MRALLYVFLALLLAAPVLSIGLSPPLGSINFAPNAAGEFDVLISNTQDRPMGTSVKVTGDLAEYISATNPDLSPRGGSTATITYALPEDIPPGMHVQYIEWREEYFDENSGMMAVRTAVKFIFRVWKPFPGKYAELDVEPENVPAGSNTQAKITVYSKGDQPIEGDLVLHLYGPDDKLLDSVTREGIAVDGNSKISKYILLDTAAYPSGLYELRGRYDYGDALARDTAGLILGERTLNILNITSVYYRDKDVNRFRVKLQSMWNYPLEGVSAQMTLGSKNAKTPSITLPAFGTKELSGYWETDKNLYEGTHTAAIRASFDDGEPVHASFPVHVYNETPKPIVEAPEPVVYIGLADVVFFLVLIALIVYFIAHLRQRHK